MTADAPRPPRRPRGSTMAAALFGGLVLVGAALVAAVVLRDDPAGRRARASAIAAELALSDPALFTEARYTRHPSLADIHSAFQDGPASLDHFPTASLVVAPRAFPAGRLEAGQE